MYGYRPFLSAHGRTTLTAPAWKGRDWTVFPSFMKLGRSSLHTNWLASVRGNESTATKSESFVHATLPPSFTRATAGSTDAFPTWTRTSARGGSFTSGDVNGACVHATTSTATNGTSRLIDLSFEEAHRQRLVTQIISQRAHVTAREIRSGPWDLASSSSFAPGA